MERRPEVMHRLRGVGIALVFSLSCLVAARGQDYEVKAVSNGGSIQGRVFFLGEFPTGEPVKVTRDPETCGISQPFEEFIVDPTNKGLKNAVLYLSDITAGKPFPRVVPRVEQKKCRYEPHVQVAQVGKLEIINQDNTLHNVHALFDPEDYGETIFNVAQPYQGHAIQKDLEEPGLVKLICDVHEWMGAWIVVRDNPYYAVTADDGSFEITEVPPGEYTLVLWHEGLGTSERTVTVEPGKATEAMFKIGSNSEEGS